MLGWRYLRQRLVAGARAERTRMRGASMVAALRSHRSDDARRAVRQTRRGRRGQRESRLDLIFGSDNAELKWKATRFIDNRWNDFDHAQLEFRIDIQPNIGRRGNPFAMEAWGQQELEYVQAPRITMAESYDVEEYWRDLDSSVNIVPQIKHDCLDYFNEMMVRDMRSAAASHRAHRAVRDAVAKMAEVRNSCRDAGQHKRLSKDITRTRRRARRQRALTSALKPRRQRDRPTAGAPSLSAARGTTTYF